MPAVTTTHSPRWPGARFIAMSAGGMDDVHQPALSDRAPLHRPTETAVMLINVPETLVRARPPFLARQASHGSLQRAPRCAERARPAGRPLLHSRRPLRARSEWRDKGITPIRPGGVAARDRVPPAGGRYARTPASRSVRSTGRRLVLDGNSRLVSPVGTHPLRNAKDIGQPVDRDNEHVLLDSLDAPSANEAHDAERPVACPPSPAPRQPVGLLPHSSDVTCFVRPRLGLDRDDDPSRGDRNGVNVAAGMPGQRMPQPPPLRLERREHALHLVLRAGTDSAATGERNPVTSVVAKSDGAEEQRSGERRRSRAQDHEPEQRDDDAGQGRFAGVDEPAILLTARVVGHCKTKVWRHVAMVPPRLDDLAATPGLLFAPGIPPFPRNT